MSTLFIKGTVIGYDYEKWQNDPDSLASWLICVMETWHTAQFRATGEFLVDHPDEVKKKYGEVRGAIQAFTNDVHSLSICYHQMLYVLNDQTPEVGLKTLYLGNLVESYVTNVRTIYDLLAVFARIVVIIVPAHDDEPMDFVKGLHEPIISETLFYKVQDVLNGNKRIAVSLTKTISRPLLPLRGFLQCPHCHRMLTGSGSKGRHQRYYYYHCGSDCPVGCRFKAEDVNDYFERELLMYKMEPAAGELFKMVVLDEYTSSNRDELDERKVLLKMIEEQ